MALLPQGKATPGDSGAQHTQGFTLPSPSSLLGPDSRIFEIASIDYEELIELCKYSSLSTLLLR